MDYSNLADEATIELTKSALEENGITVFVVQNGQEAKQKVLDLIPEKSEVMDMSSVTLQSIGLISEIQESGKYISIKKQLMAMDRKTQGSEMQKMGAAPEWAVGSVHAVTTDGKILVTSNTGSQLGAYAYGAAHVVWVVGTQKIVKDLTSAMDRIYNYCLPHESERVKKAYGMDHSNVSKILEINKEVVPNRIILIFVKEVLGV